MRIAASALLLVLAPLGAVAQTASPPLAGNDPSAVVSPPRPQSQPIAPPAPAPAASIADVSPRFVLTYVSFDGARLISARTLSPAWRALRGKSVSIADLRAIARRAEAIYAARGHPFVAVVLNPQRVQEGQVHFRVIEGKIGNLAVLGSDPVARRQATAAFQPLVDRPGLTAQDVESAYERASNIPGLAVAGALHRGETPGSMDLLVQTKRQEWNVYANVNDLYPDALGPWGVLFGVDRNGGSKFGDEETAQVYESIDGGRQTVIRGSYEQGLTASGTAFSVTALGAWADPGRAVAPLDLATDVADVRVAVSQPIIQSLAESITASAAFEVDDQKTDVFGKVGLTDDRLRIVSLSVDGVWRFANGSRLALSAELRQGLSGLGASRRGDFSLSREDADPQATVGRFSGEGDSPKYHAIRIVLRADGQIASAPLTAPEQYQIGNLTIGRGYQPGDSFGDDALAGSAEVRFGPFSSKGRISFEPFAFYDAARVWVLTPGERTADTLASVGAGVRMETPKHLHIDIAYAQPLNRPDVPGAPFPHARLLVNVTLGLNDVFDALHRRLFAGAGR